MNELLKKIAGFGIVGVIAFVIDFGILAMLKELTEMNAVLAAGISFTVSLLFNYWASMNFVFSRRNDISRTHELTVFIILSIVGLAINEIIMWAGTELISVHYLVVKIGATAIVMIWNFWSRNRWLDAKE